MAQKIRVWFSLAFIILPASLIGQPDTASAILADSARVTQTVELNPATTKKVKTWPIATAVALILVSSYLLYNVRSR